MTFSLSKASQQSLLIVELPRNRTYVAAISSKEFENRYSLWAIDPDGDRPPSFAGTINATPQYWEENPDTIRVGYDDISDFLVSIGL